MMNPFRKMKKEAESLLTRKIGRSSQMRRSSPVAPSVMIPVFASVIAAISCIAFALSFQRALAGFSSQISAFVSVGSWQLRVLSIVLAVFAVLFLLYLLFIHLASLHYFNNCLNRFGSSFVLCISALGSQAFLVSWVLVLCGTCAVSLLYFFFIGAIYAFCALVDQECFDFKVLLPAVVRIISKKNIDLTFCEEKKALLCDRENNMIWSFSSAFVLGMIAFAGSLIVQNMVVYGFGKRQGSSPLRKAENEQIIEMHEVRTGVTATQDGESAPGSS